MQQQRQRSGLIIGLVALGLLAGAALTASPAQAASGPGPYYAEPAWDQKFSADTRFLVLTNWNSDAVLDKETGLVWERSPAAATATWAEALVACTALTTGNRKGWRLPSVHELASLIRPPRSVPFRGLALQPGHPFLTVLPASYWSATTDVDVPTSAWGVDIGDGTVNSLGKSTTDDAWCVRGGMHADQY